MAYLSTLSRDGLQAVLTLFLWNNPHPQTVQTRLSADKETLLKDITECFRRTSIYRETGIDLITFLNLPLKDIEILIKT